MIQNILYLGPKKGGAANIMKSIATHFNGLYVFSIVGYISACLSPKKQLLHSALPVINIFRRPVILHVHGNYLKERSLKHPLTFLYPLSVRFASKIIVPSKALKKDLRLSSAVVIPNFLTTKPKVTSKKYTYLTVTSFDFKDKASGVLKIAAALKDISDFSWCIVGEGKYRAEIQTEVESILGSKVIFTGFRKNPFEHTGDVFLYWSDFDSFGLVLLEAHAAGMPIVCNNFPAAKEILSKENLADSVEDFRNKLGVSESTLLQNFDFPKKELEEIYASKTF